MMATRFTALERDILALSSGTIACLTGRSDYQSIDDIQGDFLTFVRYRYFNRQPWTTWAEAWKDFDTYCNRAHSERMRAQQ
jgi:hypothetical protein